MSTRRYITCEEVINFLADYLDRELTAAKNAEFERHLSVCDSCVAYIATYEETIRMARASASAPQLRIEDVPEQLVRAIVASLGE